MTVAPSYAWPDGGAPLFPLRLDALAHALRYAYGAGLDLGEAAVDDEEQVARFSAFLHGINRPPAPPSRDPIDIAMARYGISRERARALYVDGWRP